MEHVLWQDIVISVGGYIFLAALVPSIIGKDKPAISTSITTGSVLLAFAFAYSTLSLWSSVFSTLLMSFAWFFLGWQKYREHSRMPQ